MKTMGDVLLRCLWTLVLALVLLVAGPLALLGWVLTATTLPAAEWTVVRLRLLWPPKR